MYPRDLRLPDCSFFLFGPRGTGKTTWLQSVLPRARWFNLLLDRELVRLLRSPEVFAQEVRPRLLQHSDRYLDRLLAARLAPAREDQGSGHAKFYLFDTGAVRALARRLDEPLGDRERGHLLETYVLHELRAWIGRHGVASRYERSFPRIPGLSLRRR